MSDTPETDQTHPERIDGLCMNLERERNMALKALHQCYAATGEDAGDIGDYRALVDREKHTVNAVREMRRSWDKSEDERDELLRTNAELAESLFKWREIAGMLAEQLYWWWDNRRLHAPSQSALAEFDRLKGADK